MARIPRPLRITVSACLPSGIESLTCVGDAAPPMPQMPALLTAAMICSGVTVFQRARGGQFNPLVQAVVLDADAEFRRRFELLTRFGQRALRPKRSREPECPARRRGLQSLRPASRAALFERMPRPERQGASPAGSPPRPARRRAQSKRVSQRFTFAGTPERMYTAAKRFFQSIPPALY